MCVNRLLEFNNYSLTLFDKISSDFIFPVLFYQRNHLNTDLRVRHFFFLISFLVKIKALMHYRKYRKERIKLLVYIISIFYVGAFISYNQTQM